ncbi:MAG: YbbC/YhhH family protein [Oscillospiraceae bacterium]|nr:YbbC/YhhH family protein [Oscillospiraceae bacterium]
MKKRLLFWIGIVLIIALVGGSIFMFVFRTIKTTEAVGTFKLTDYSFYIENFPSEIVLGTIDSAQSAKEKAEEIWIEIYGDTAKNKKPYIVSFDELNQVWMVQGTLPNNWVGGVPYIIFRKADGKVLAVWHDK